MKKICRGTLVISLLVPLVVLASCRHRGFFAQDEPGVAFTPPTLSEDIDKSSEPSTESDVSDVGTLAGDETVYWTETGSVYHIRRECYHLSKAKHIIEGTAQEAVAQGKERLCKNCSHALDA